MIVAVCLELDGNNGSATQSRSRRRTSQAAAGPVIIRRAAGPNNAANATRAIIRRFLADRPRGEKARAAGAIAGDAGLPAEPAAAVGTPAGDVALSSARGSHRLLELKSGVISRPPRAGQRVERQGCGAARVA